MRKLVDCAYEDLRHFRYVKTKNNKHKSNQESLSELCPSIARARAEDVIACLGPSFTRLGMRGLGIGLLKPLVAA